MQENVKGGELWNCSNSREVAEATTSSHVDALTQLLLVAGNAGWGFILSSISDALGYRMAQGTILGSDSFISR